MYDIVIMVKKFTTIPITPEAKARLKGLTYDLRVDSFDAVVVKLMDFYEERKK